MFLFKKWYTKNFIFLFILISINGKAQQKIAAESLIPPAPNAAELGKYSTYPVGTLTGIPEISFPLYEINSGKLRLPISLSYHASGIQVSQKATDVGLGWSVMAGGQISRTVYGVADDNPTVGNFNVTPLSYNDIMGISNYYILENYASFSGIDLEPDLFAYNMGGKSGKFLFKKDRTFMTIPFDPIKIDKVSGGPIIHFQIKDDNGTIYTFNKVATTISEFGPSPRQTVSTWYLTSMKSHDLTDSITFTYDIVGFNDPMTQNVFPIGQGIRTIGPTTQNYTINGKTDALGNPTGLVDIKSRENLYNECLINKITFKEGYVLFKRNNNRKDTNPNSQMLDSIIVYNNSGLALKKIAFSHSYKTAIPFTEYWTCYRLILDGFSEIDPGTKLRNKEYKFDYDNTPLPPYGSNNIDYWGYSNGAYNPNDLIPVTKVYASEIINTSFTIGSYSNWFTDPHYYWTIGTANREPEEAHMRSCILKKITYPTGGYNTFDYEAHKYLSDEYITDNISYSGINTFGTGNCTSSSRSYTFQYPSISGRIPANIEPVHADLNIIFSAYMPPVEPCGQNQVVQLIDISTTPFTVLGTWTHTGDPIIPLTLNVPVILFSGHQYQIVHNVYGLLTASVNSYIHWIENTMEHKVKIGGGLRVSSIKTYTASNTIAKEDSYIYGVTDGLGEKLFNEKTFYKNYEDVASDYYMGLITCETPSYCVKAAATNQTCWERDFMGISKYNTLNYMGSPILYSQVIKYEGTPTNNNGRTIISYSIHKDDIILPNEFMNSGNYGSIGNAWLTADIKEELVQKKKDNTYINIMRTNYEYGNFDIQVENPIMLKQHKRFVKLCDCYTLSSGPEPGSTYFGQGFFVMTPYPIKTGVSKRTREINKVYNENNPYDSVTTFKEYYYENPLNRYLTKQTISTSEGDNIQKLTKLKYPNDDTTDAVSVAMVSKNILTPVLEEKTFKSVSGINTLLNTLQTTYVILGNLIVKSNIKASTGLLNPEVRITFDKYDQSTGNILQQSKSDDIKQSYIWGYNNTYPVVKAEGIAYDNIPSSIVANIASHSFSNGTTYSATKNDVAYLKGQLSGLIRDTLMVTFYTYAPLVGMTSQTDPKGITTYYEYNTLLQLDRVLDDKGNILKEYINHYYNQPSPITVYYNVAMSQVFTRQTCAAGTLPDTYTYSVAANTYSSEISQTDANTKAQNDINTNGQNAANANAICYYINPSSTTLSYPETEGTQYVTVTSNLTYTITSNSGWITVSPSSISGNGTLTIVCSTNSGVARSGTVTLQYSGSKGILTKVITINQAIASFISANPTSLTFNFITGELKTVAVSSVATWSVLSTTGGFITATKLNSTTLQVQCTANTKTTARTGTVTITNGINQVIINVTQYGKGGPTNSPVQSGG